MEKSKRKNSDAIQWKWLIVLGGLLLALLLIIGTSIFAVFTSFDTDIEYSNDSARQPIETFIGTSLPDEATDLHYYKGGFQDWYVLIKFTIPANEHESLLANAEHLCFDTLTTPSDDVNAIGLDIDWWTRYSDDIISESECRVGAQFHNLHITQETDNQQTLYISVFTS